MKIIYYKDARKQWRWKFVARNGRSIAVSGEGYKQFKRCQEGASRTALMMAVAPEVGAPL